MAYQIEPTELEGLYLAKRALEDAIITSKHYGQLLTAQAFREDLREVENRIAELELAEDEIRDEQFSYGDSAFGL